ncbi:MAG: DUF2274 domain-containing protein [Sphingomonadales bacterium]|nr:DUF2274 domain-containing protein [Sphingomonadales bacterium]MDE2570258.1 DUF2274 domain-containing protein [Sphingomonadales bacterium]
MANLKLAQLPDRTPIKMSILVLPDLHQALQDYARIYADAYGREESLAELVPAMLAAFLDSDRTFAKLRGPQGRQT